MNKKLPAWIMQNGLPFDRQRSLKEGYKACTYIIIDPKNRFYLGKKIVTRAARTSDDLENYGGSATDPEYQRMLNKSPEKFMRIILGLFETEDEALTEEFMLTIRTDLNGQQLWERDDCVNLRPGGHGFSSIANPACLPENRIKSSNRMKAMWQDEEFREKRIANINESKKTESYSETMSIAIAESWQDEKIREIRTQGLIVSFTEERRAEMGRKSRERWANEEWKATMVEKMRKDKGKMMVFGFKNRKFLLETLIDWPRFIGSDKRSGTFNRWIRGKNKTYVKYGLEFIRKINDDDDINDYENPWNDLKLRRKLTKLFKNKKSDWK